jgi:hypothetical protein
VRIGFHRSLGDVIGRNQNSLRRYLLDEAIHSLRMLACTLFSWQDKVFYRAAATLFWAGSGGASDSVIHV